MRFLEEVYVRLHSCSIKQKGIVEFSENREFVSQWYLMALIHV
jgi:hypothetical protein